jgi:hypothetical protein
VFAKLKTVFAPKDKDRKSLSASSTAVAAATSSSSAPRDDASTDAHLFDLRLTAPPASASLIAAAVAVAAPLDAVQQLLALAALDGSVWIATHDAAVRRIVASSGDRVSRLFVLANAALLAVARGRVLELFDFSAASASDAPVFTHQFMSDVTAFCFTAGETHLFVGLKCGDVHVVVVSADAAPPYLSAFVIAAADTHEECTNDALRALGSRSRAPVLQLIALPNASSPTILIAHAESNVTVRFNVASQKVERLYYQREGVGEAPLSAVAVHPNGDDVLCVHSDGQWVMFSEKKNAPVAHFRVRGGDGADIGVGVSHVVWTGDDDTHALAVVRFDADFKHSVVSVVRGERLDAMRVVDEVPAPNHVDFVGLSLIASSPFESDRVSHALATRSDGRVVAISLIDGLVWQPTPLPSLFHVNRTAFAATLAVDVGATAMFVGDDAGALSRAPLWPAHKDAPRHAPPVAVDASEAAVVLFGVQRDLCVAAFELATQQSLWRADLASEVAKVDAGLRVFGVADSVAVSRAGRPLLLVSCVIDSEESENRIVLAFATSRLAPDPTSIESDFGAFKCQGAVARGARVRIERCHEAAIAVIAEAGVTVFAVDAVGLVNQSNYARSGGEPASSVTMLSADSVALLLKDESIVRACAAFEDNTELKAARADDATAPIRAFMAVTPDAESRFFGQQEVPRFVLCSGRDVRITVPPWLDDAELDAEERDFLGSSESVVQCNGLIRRAWLVRIKTSALYIVVYTARESLQVFRAADLALVTTLELSSVCDIDNKPLDVCVFANGTGVCANPSEVTRLTLWARDAAEVAAAGAPPAASVFVCNVALPERKSGLLGSLFGTVKKNRAKAATLLSTKAPTVAPTPAAMADAATVAERMQMTKQKLLENREKMEEVADKSADLADQSESFAKMAAQLGKEKKSFFSF